MPPLFTRILGPAGRVLSRFRFKWGIGPLITLSIVLLIAQVVATITVLDIRREQGKSQDELEQQGIRTAQALSDVLGNPRLSGNADHLEGLANIILSQSNVSYFQYFDAGGTLLVDSLGSTARSSAGEKAFTALENIPSIHWTDADQLEVSGPVLINGEVVGGYRFGLADDLLSAEINAIVYQHLLLGLVLIGAGIIIAWILGQYFVRPIKRLVRATEDLTEGQFNFVPLASRNDEIGDLTAAFGVMSSTLGEKTVELETTNQRLLTEVRERKVLESELLQARDTAIEATRAQSLFLSSVSHELRTPMNAIIGSTDLLSRTQVTPRQREYLQITQRAGETLLDLINDTLDLAKVEAGQLRLEKIEFDLVEIIHDTAQLLAVRAEEKNLELICRIKPEVPSTLIGDPVRLRQVITNLLSNAIKFTEEGEVVVEVQIEDATAERGPLLFQVSDTGIGLPSQKLESVFYPFAQVDASTTRQHGGTGLGLAICRQLVQLMGGRIWVESELGIGSTFYFTAQFETQDRDVNNGDTPFQALAGFKVLVVDDNALFCAFLEELLDDWGAGHRSACCGSQALDELSRAAEEEEPYDLVLLDREMPDMGGLEVISHMRREPAIKDIPVIVVTGTSDLRDDSTLEPGLDICGWLTKPLSQSDLLQAITAARGLGLGGDPDWTPPEDSINAEALPELRILLVDDYDDNRFVVQAHLEDTPYQIDTAENGEIAIDMFKSVNYDLVLMDVQMPVMDGYTATRLIRRWEQEQGLTPTPIVALTANAFAEDVHKSMEAGCTGHINKPIRRAPLMAEIAECTNGGTQ